MSRIRITCIAIAFVPVTLIMITIGWLVGLSDALPEGTPGPEADAAARAMMQAANVAAFEQIPAISWNFGERQDHLWDRQRSLSRVRWGDHEVLFSLETRQGIAFTDGQPVTDAAARDALVEQAWSHWCNDSFWLNPVGKVFDEGTSRSLVTLSDGRAGLKISYDSGGVTPGDSYVWVIDEETGLPSSWRMWVDIIPVGGVETTWEDWMQLPGGAQVAQNHEFLGMGFTLTLSEIETASSAAALEGGSDPFAALVQ